MRLIWQLPWAALLALLVVYCATGRGSDSRDASDHSLGDAANRSDSSVGPDGAGPDGSVTMDAATTSPDGAPSPDAAPSPDGAPSPDAAPSPDGAPSPDAAPGPDSAVGPDASGSPLDPNLEVPPSGTPCDTPGSSSECGYLEVCRFYDSVQGRCESCTSCGSLGAYCTASDQCDILFTCYLNTCTNICPLGTTYCGPIPDCLDIGHPTHGVCAP